MSSRGRSAGTHRDLVHPRTRQSCGTGVHRSRHPRGLALCRVAGRPVQGLRQHLAQNQDRSQWVAKGVRHQETAPNLPRQLPNVRGDRSGVPQDRTQPWASFVGQDDVELHVGKIRTASQQVPSQGVHRPSGLHSVLGQRPA